MKWLYKIFKLFVVLIIVVLLLLLNYSCKEKPVYEYTVNLISCVNKVDRVIIYQSDENPYIRAHQRAVPIFYTNRNNGDEYLNICDFKIIRKTLVE